MGIREEIQHRRLRLQWQVMDALIATNDRIPYDFENRSDRFGYLLVLPAVLIISFLPIGVGLLVWFSLNTYDPVEIVVQDFTLENWDRFVSTPAFHDIFIRTFLYSVVITVLCVVLAIPYAYLIIRVKSGLLRLVLLFSLFIPFFSGVVIRAYGWMIILGENGLLNWLITSVGIDSIRILGTGVSVVIGIMQFLLPFTVLLLTPAISNIDRDIERAARNCGATRFQMFRHVVLPLAKPGLIAAIIVTFALAMKSYAIPDLLGGGNVDFAANFIFQKVFGTLNYPLAAVLSLVLIGISSTIVLVVFKIYGTGTLGTEVKEA